MADSALTAEQRERLTELFNEHLFEINLEGDDLVFYAECEDLELEASNPLLAGVHTVEDIARVSLRAVVTNAVQFIVQDSEDQNTARNALFAMSGRLREMVTLIEYEAIKISASIADEEESPTLLPAEERERMKALHREAEEESPSGGNGNGNGAEPH